MRRLKIERWRDYISHPHPRRIPGGPGKTAQCLDRLIKRALLLLILWFFWLGLGMGPVWSILAAFLSMGLLSRERKERRSIRLITQGKRVWQDIRGKPEDAKFNHRFLALTGMGLTLLVLSGVLSGPWSGYYSTLGIINIIMSLLVLWLRGRRIPDPEQN